VYGVPQLQNIVAGDHIYLFIYLFVSWIHS